MSSRNQALEFKPTTPAEAPPVYSRSSSGRSAAEIQELRRKFELQREQADKQRPSFRFTPPQYDQEFTEAMITLETS